MRTHWERIEPVAEFFGDLDPKLDLRKADPEPGKVWTGWHRAEELETKFAFLQTELDTHAKGNGFRYYNGLTPAQVRKLAALVDTLGEPLSRLTAAVVL